jgi:hypothetical protein
MPTQRNIEIWRGSDPLEIWRAYDASGNPVDFTGYTLRFVVRDRANNIVIANNLLLESAMPARAISRASAVWGNTNGCIAVEITRAQSMLLEVGASSKYEIEPRIDGFQEAPMFFGVVIVKGGVNDD